MFADSFHPNLSSAIAEMQRRRKEADTEQLITRIEESPYGGFRVRSVPAEFVVDHLADVGVMSPSASAWSKLVA